MRVDRLLVGDFAVEAGFLLLHDFFEAVNFAQDFGEGFEITAVGDVLPGFQLEFVHPDQDFLYAGVETKFGQLSRG